MPSIVVTVDVEEDMPDWRVPPTTTLRNLQGIPRLQALCEGHGIRPTYLVTYPVATRSEGDGLQEIHDGGRCEIGAHLHPWTSPPFEDGEDLRVATHPSALPPGRAEAKLAVLTEAIERRFGHRPTSHRAGRFGLDGRVLEAVEQLGYRVDSSATPLHDWTAEGGVDWRDAPQGPYYPDRAHPWRPGPCPVLQVPVSVGWSRPLPDRIGRALIRAPRGLHLLGILDNPIHSLLRLSWLYPVSDDADAMGRLARSLVALGVESLVVFGHSSELWPGESPYHRSEAEVDRGLARLDAFLGRAVGELGARPRTLTELADDHADRGRAPC